MELKNSIKNQILFLKTIYDLGFINCFRVVIYRLIKKSKILIFFSPINDGDSLIFTPTSQKLVNFDYEWFNDSRVSLLKEANQICSGFFIFFNHSKQCVTANPKWHKDYKSKFIFESKKHWTLISDLPEIDIKNCWELSRWDWINYLAIAWKLTGKKKYISTINSWSKSWMECNPFNQGSNWLCAQEVSIRLIHVLQALFLIEEIHKPERRLSSNQEDFIAKHLKRINLTTSYAKAQQNNHWTSEAAALFIGGSLLMIKSYKYRNFGRICSKKGRKELENNVNHLIMQDGSFSQNSTNYHRLFLDTLSQAEIWRRRLKLKSFSNRLLIKCELATKWLESLVDKISGDVPNLGANDGAYCYQLHKRDYRDFRYSLQLASSLFCEFSSLRKGKWDEQLIWEQIKPNYQKQNIQSKKTINFLKNGGYLIINKSQKNWALLRIPNYKFRPTNIDPLHFDLWNNGENILRDGGSYSYNTEKKYFDFFFGIKSHNSVEFNNEEPMKKISKFLCINWLREKNIYIYDNKDHIKVSSKYKYLNGFHRRDLYINKNNSEWIILDYLDKFKMNAILRWRLIPDDWVVTKNKINGNKAEISIDSNLNNFNLKLINEWESRFYSKRDKVPVIFIKIPSAPAIIKTTIKIQK